MVEWTAADIPDLSHRIAVVTGANSGIGLETAKELARAGATVIMACRSIDRGTAARAELVEELGRDRHPLAGTGGGDGRTVEDRLVVSELDLTRPDSIDGFVSRLAQWRSDTAERLSVAAERSGETERPGEPARSGEPAQTGHLRYGGDGLAAGIDLLINNAGIMACPPSLTEQGVERQWASNHLGHFALTGRLLPFMVDGGRVVSVSSLAAQGGDLSKPIPTTLDDYSRFQVYSDTKLANQVFAVELNHRLAASGSTTISLAAHPGISHTNLGAGLGIPIATTVLKGLSRLMTQSPVVGALPTLRAATDPKAEGGQYYGPSGRNQHRGPPKQLPLVTGASRRSLGRDLWEQSMELTGVRYLTGG